jgi:poly-D-alanine transfer protein DltD
MSTTPQFDALVKQATPGPWRVDADPRRGDTLCDHIVEQNGNAICFMASKSDDDFEEQEANARLLSLAPHLKEMRDALADVSSKVHDAAAGRINFREDFAERVDAALSSLERSAKENAT